MQFAEKWSMQKEQCGSQHAALFKKCNMLIDTVDTVDAALSKVALSIMP